MTSDAIPEPGSMTVPPLFGWESLVVGLVLASVIGVAYLVLSAMSASGRASEDWDAWLDGRSRNRPDLQHRPATPPVPVEAASETAPWRGSGSGR